MDKLRAIQYFNRAVETGSFGAAARAFEVSTPAVTQLVGSLERTLGVTLFHRSTRGPPTARATTRSRAAPRPSWWKSNSTSARAAQGRAGSSPSACGTRWATTA